MYMNVSKRYVKTPKGLRGNLQELIQSTNPPKQALVINMYVVKLSDWSKKPGFQKKRNKSDTDRLHGIFDSVGN